MKSRQPEELTPPTSFAKAGSLIPRWRGCDDCGRGGRDLRALRRATTILEVVVATSLVGVLLVASLRTLRNSTFAQYKLAERATAENLGEDLMAEILVKAYEEPDDPIEFGRESGEGSGSRTNWDDVDDYHGLSQSPPTQSDGTTMPNLSGWQRTVTIQWVTSANLTVVSSGETGLKRITVGIAHNNLTIWSRSRIRARFP